MGIGFRNQKGLGCTWRGDLGVNGIAAGLDTWPALKRDIFWELFLCFSGGIGTRRVWAPDGRKLHTPRPVGCERGVRVPAHAEGLATGEETVAARVRACCLAKENQHMGSCNETTHS